MKLFHTSPAPITRVSRGGRFGSCLFFSCKPYSMSVGDVITYSIEIDDAELISARELFYHELAAELEPIVNEVAARCGVDAETAEKLIEGRVTMWDIETSVDADDVAEADYDVQHAAARCAVLLGYRGVSLLDEQGTSYLIDMFDRECELSEA